MEFFKKRGTAVVVAVVVICLSTLFSVHRTLGAECKKVSGAFYSGVEEAGWGTTRPSISAQIRTRTDAADWVLTLAANYDEVSNEAQSLLTANEHLKNAAGPSEVYPANRELTAAYNELADAMTDLSLTEREERGLEEYGKKMRGAQTLIDNSGYNELVREFQSSTLDVFPTNVLQGLAQVKTPELFE